MPLWIPSDGAVAVHTKMGELIFFGVLDKSAPSYSNAIVGWVLINGLRPMPPTPPDALL